MSKKTTTIVLGGAVLLTLVFATYWYQFKNDQNNVAFPQLSNWQTFSIDPQHGYAKDFPITFAKNNFTFKYPPAWIIREYNPRAIVELYNPEAAATLITCEKDRKPEDCGQAESDATISLFPSLYVDYASLSAIEILNYPHYQKLEVGGLDVFKYYPNTEPKTLNYHINTPDRESGLEFSVEVDEAAGKYIAVLEDIVKTFQFKP